MPSQPVGRSVSRDPAGLPPRSKNSYILYKVYTHDNILCTYIIRYFSAYKLFIQEVGVLNMKTLPHGDCVTSKIGYLVFIILCISMSLESAVLIYAYYCEVVLILV